MNACLCVTLSSLASLSLSSWNLQVYKMDIVLHIKWDKTCKSFAWWPTLRILHKWWLALVYYYLDQKLRQDMLKEMKEVYKGHSCWEVSEVPPRWLKSGRTSQQGWHLSRSSGLGQISADQSWVCRMVVQEEGTGWTKMQKGKRSGAGQMCFSNSRDFKNRGKGKQNKEMEAFIFPLPRRRETSWCFPVSCATIGQKGPLIYTTPPSFLGPSASQLVKQSLSIILLPCHNPSWGRQNLLGVCYSSLAAAANNPEWGIKSKRNPLVVVGFLGGMAPYWVEDWEEIHITDARGNQEAWCEEKALND